MKRTVSRTAPVVSCYIVLSARERVNIILIPTISHRLLLGDR